MNFRSFHAFSLVLLPILVGFPPTKSNAQDFVVSTPQSSASAGSYYCPKCGRYHAAPNQSSAIPVSAIPVTSGVPVSSGVTQTSYQPAGWVGGYSSSGLRGGGGVQNVLSTLNAQRARQGIGSLSYDPALQAVAQQRAQLMASMQIKSHPPGSFSPGTYEGVGWSSSYSPSGVSACFTSDPNMRAAGAAMATGADGVYFAVVYR